jgi:hypothetical protein
MTMSKNHKEKVEVINKAITFITEFLDTANVCVFVNWVENGETLRAEILRGNQFAIKGQIEKWACENLDEVQDGYSKTHEDQ